MRYTGTAVIRAILIGALCAVIIPTQPQSIIASAILMVIFIVNDFRSKDYRKYFAGEKENVSD